jgi:hypothetical protein
MADLRTQLALVLGVGLGLVLIAHPSLVVRVHTVGRLPQDRGGQYGEDDSLSPAWRHVVRAGGVALIAVALWLWL